MPQSSFDPSSSVNARQSHRPANSPLALRNLSDALTFYEERLGFELDVVYADFYASVSRDGAAIHLKCDPKLEEERAHWKSGEHLDAYLSVSGIHELHEELVGRGARILKPLE